LIEGLEKKNWKIDWIEKNIIIKKLNCKKTMIKMIKIF
jgi:hypothetical protein